MINTNVTILPSQLVPRTEKLAKIPDTIKDTTGNTAVENKTWGQNTLDFHITLAQAQQNNRTEMYMLSRLKDGTITLQDYDYITNPFNTDNEKYKRYPATLRCYNIIQPVINEFIGERTEKPINPMVVLGNKDADNIFKQRLNSQVKQLLQQKFINELNALGIDTGVPSKEVEEVQSFIARYTKEYDKSKAIEGQNILDYIVYEQELDEKYQKAFEDWLTFGRVISYTNVVKGELRHEIVSALDFYFPIHGNNEDIADGPWGVRKFRYTNKFQILDRLHTILDKEDLEWLEEQFNHANNSGVATTVFGDQRVSSIDNGQTQVLGEVRGFNTDNIILWHVEWKSFRKVGLLTTIGVEGQVVEIEVDETYKLNKNAGDISIAWEYITEVWEGYRIDGLYDNVSKYYGIKPLLVQRNELNTNQRAKLSYGGRFEVDIDGKIKSTVKTGTPYQLLYNTFHYQFEKIMNKNKDKILMIPIGLMPKKAGWDEEKFMYFADALSFGFYDESAPNANAAIQGMKVMDMGLSQYAAKMFEFLQAIKQEWWDAVGMNRQRYGETQASDGKAVNEQAIFHSALITAELNRKFDKFQERDYQSLLDWSKVAWINGKKANYPRSDGALGLLEIDGDEHLGTDYNVFVKNSNKEYRKLETMRQVALSLNQNGTKGSDIAKLIDANNIATITSILEKGEAIEQEFLAQQEEAKNKAIVDAADRVKEAAITKEETQMYIADKNYDAIVDRENMVTDREMFLAGIQSDTTDNGTDNADTSFERMIKSAELVIKQRKQRLEEKKHIDEVALKKDDQVIKRIAARKKSVTK